MSSPATAGDPVHTGHSGVARPALPHHLKRLPGGPVKPGDYLNIITHGPVQIRASALNGAIKSGDKLTIDSASAARSLETVEVNGVRLAEDAPTIGIALDNLPVGKEDMIWVLVNPQ